MNLKNQGRAVKYRELALNELDQAKATLLLTIADEAERNVLCTVDSTNLGYSRRDEQKLATQSQKVPIQTYTGH
jgi:hypothetical protein